MTIRNKEPRTNDLHLERLIRKRDQHWHMASLARRDADSADEARHIDLARYYARQVSEYLAGQL